MTFRTSLTCAVFTVCLGLFAAGCSDRSSSRGNTAPPTGTASAPPATPGTPTTAGNGPASGTVGNLTGDPDGEVSPALQQQVADGLAKGDDDDPVDF